MADSGPRLRVARPATPRSAATSTSAGSAEPLPVPEPTYAAAGPRKSKSLCVAYLCWIIGGFWGLHHFYLERDQQAWLWFSSFGGLGVGWLLDLCLMRRYVNDCNETPEVIDSYRIALKYRARPAGSIVRWLADIFVSNWFGFMMTGIYDKDLTPAWAQALLYAVGAAVGVWLVNSAGSDRSASLYQTVRHSLVGFGLGWFTTQYCGQFSISPSVGAVCGALHGVNRDLRFRVPVQCIPVWPEDVLAAPTAQPPPEHGGDGSGVVPARGSSSAAAPAVPAIKPASRPTQRITARRARSTCLRAVWFGMWTTLCLSVLGLHLYHNLTLSVEGGEQLKLKEHLHNVAKSPVWQQLPLAIRQLYDHARAYGFANTWKDFVKALDMDGEQHAYSVLGLTPDATDTDIKQAFRRLALQYHPDKQPAELRETAEQEFVKITQAHDTLMKINEKKRRRRQRMNPDH